MILLGIITKKCNKIKVESTFYVVHTKIYIAGRIRIREVFLLKRDGNLEPNYRALDGRFSLTHNHPSPESYLNQIFGNYE